jgi:hypothetical protein
MVRFIPMNTTLQAVQAQGKVQATVLPSSTFRLADVMQALVVQTLGAAQEWTRKVTRERQTNAKIHHQSGERVDDEFETTHQGMSVSIRVKSRFGHQSTSIPERCLHWELRFNMAGKKEKVLDGSQLTLEPETLPEAHDPQQLKGMDLIRTLIKAVYVSVASEQEKRHQPWVSSIQHLYDKAMDGLVPYAVRDIPPSLMNPLAGGATLLEIGDGAHRLEITSFTGLDDESTRFKLTLRNEEGVHRLPSSVMNHSAIARCVHQLFNLLTPPKPMPFVELMESQESFEQDEFDND